MRPGCGIELAPPTDAANAADVGADANSGMELERHEPERPAGRDFARQLREKMSMMAQRLFQGGTRIPAAVDLGPRHDHQTEMTSRRSVGAGSSAAATPRSSRAPAARRRGPRADDHAGQLGHAIRERGLPETGELVRGMSDAAALLAKMFHGGITGRVRFRRDDVDSRLFEQRAGRCSRRRASRAMDGRAARARGQDHGSRSTSGARPWSPSRGGGGVKILVDFGYLKRRELLPAVRRHVEDRSTSLFGWDRGQYHITDRPASRRPSDPAVAPPRVADPRGHSPQARPRDARAPARAAVDRGRARATAAASATVVGAPRSRVDEADAAVALVAAARGRVGPPGTAATPQLRATSPTSCRSRGGCACSGWRPLAAPTPSCRRDDRAGRRNRSRDRPRARPRALAARDRGGLLRAARRPPRRDRVRGIRRAYQAARRDFAPIASPATSAASSRGAR